MWRRRTTALQLALALTLAHWCQQRGAAAAAYAATSLVLILADDMARPRRAPSQLQARPL